MANLALAASVSSKALTVALKGEDGNDPSASNPVSIRFRDETLATGTPNVRTVTGALSVVLPSGGTLGFAAGGAGRIYVWAIDNAGTVELALSRTADIFPESNLVSTTAIGTGSDSASAMYSTSARTNVACRCIGYIEITTGATAGEWDNAPTKIQIMGPGVKRSGEIVQVQTSSTATHGATNALIPWDNTKPQNTEGMELLTVTITPRSASNRLIVEAFIPTVDVSTVGGVVLALFQDSRADALATALLAISQGYAAQLHLRHEMYAETENPATFKIRIGTTYTHYVYWLRRNDALLYDSTLVARMTVTEVEA